MIVNLSELVVGCLIGLPTGIVLALVGVYLLPEGDVCKCRCKLCGKEKR